MSGTFDFLAGYRAGRGQALNLLEEARQEIVSLAVEIMASAAEQFVRIASDYVTVMQPGTQTLPDVVAALPRRAAAG